MHDKTPVLKRPWKISQIKLDSLSSLIRKEGYSPLFGFHLNTSGDSTWFTFLSKKDSIVRFEIEHNYKRSNINFNPIISSNEYYTSLIRGDTIHILNQKRNVYYQYRITISNEKKLIDSFDFGKNKMFKNCNVNLLVGKPGLTFKWPYVWFQYGHLRKKYYIDKKAYFKINLLDRTLKKVIDYPKCYYCCYQYLPTSSLIISDNNETVCVFDYYDKLFVSNETKQMEKIINIEHKCKMVAYDKTKERNLAYTKKFLENEEVNIGLFKLYNNQVILLKRNSKQKILDLPKYSIYLFDENYNQVFSEEINENLGDFPKVFEYKKGILLFNESLNTANYYELAQ